MGNPMMKCGHAANAKDGNGRHVCVICYGISAGATEIDEGEFIGKGRMAKCGCGMTRPSDPDTLAFYEYRGVGATNIGCKHCGYALCVHDGSNVGTHRKVITDHDYEPRVDELDIFYCGCRGWN